MIDLQSVALLVGAGFLGGAINAIAGGATFFTFPAMMAAGLGPVAANASNTVALAPSSFVAFLAMRRHIGGARHLLLSFLIVGVLGGAFGAWLVLWLGDARFRACIPWLLLVATVLFAAGPWLVRMMKKADIHHERRSVRVLGHIFQGLIGIYGGFFGAGMGMVTLAGLTLLGLTDIRAMNALKNLFTALTNAIAIVVFAAAGAVSWPHALVMMAGGVAGGFAGGKLAVFLPADRVRLIVAVVGTLLTVAYFISG
ncbi:MAG TPA: sulfite exporter TauE/SafE family protein [Rhodospirillales bacterium]|nr:sulfite exporter TauE/SafE family protein [Rhodospirillales bacterium]